VLLNETRYYLQLYSAYFFQNGTLTSWLIQTKKKSVKVDWMKFKMSKSSSVQSCSVHVFSKSFCNHALPKHNGVKVLLNSHQSPFKIWISGFAFKSTTLNTDQKSIVPFSYFLHLANITKIAWKKVQNLGFQI